MVKIILMSLCCLTVFADDVVPRLFISYYSVFDGACAAKTGYKIDPAWTHEAGQRAKEFQKSWDVEGTAFAQELIHIVGRPFSRKEMSVALTVCNFPSMSHPLLVNVRWAMKSFRPGREPLPPYAVNTTIFHELIHTYLTDDFKWEKSKLAAKYRHEARSVRSHLHLMALEKAVYVALKRDDILSYVSKYYANLGGAYLRSWQIVDHVEGYEVFIEELKRL